MKIIKFRGKDSSGNWLFGGITEDKKFITDKFIFTGVKPETVGQFTGFYDETNKEIYEDDIVKLNAAPYHIKWLERIGGFVAENTLMLMTLSNLENYRCQIVGNIHDNPNLLNKLQADFLGA